MKHLPNEKNRSGQLSVTLLFFAALTVVLITGFVFLATSFLQLSARDLNRTRAFTIAEAGVEYYRWHLAHASTDFQDGSSSTGPYVHTYYDKDGTAIGTFSLDITAPPAGSTVVKVRSTGKVNADSSITKIIEVRLAIPSFAKYAWALNDNVNFGSSAEVFGPIHSNQGIHFDGVAHNLVSSALGTYIDPDHATATEYAVHTHSGTVDPPPPAALPARTDVFMASRTMSVPALDFTQLTQDLADIKTLAVASGTYFSSSTAFGYDLALATSGTYTLYRITALVNASSGCSSSATGWGTWSIQTETQVSTGTIPNNGSLFFEDNLWVRGQISGKRVTIASGRFPDNASTRSSITVNSNLLYTDYTGLDAISLIAQNNINIGLNSADTLRIDGALIAQNGRIGRYSYSSSNCGSNRIRASVTFYGMLGTATRPGFYYSASNGYQARTYVYDTNLLYGPPPNFPLTTDQYTPISWSEVQ